MIEKIPDRKGYRLLLMSVMIVAYITAGCTSSAPPPAQVPAPVTTVTEVSASVTAVVPVTTIPQSMVTASPTPQESKKEFTVTVDDSGFSPSTISLNRNDSVILHLRFNDDNIYYGGMDVKSDQFPAIEYRIGSMKNRDVAFVPTSSFKISAYWPSSGVLKGDLKGEVT